MRNECKQLFAFTTLFLAQVHFLNRLQELASIAESGTAYLSMEQNKRQNRISDRFQQHDLSQCRNKYTGQQYSPRYYELLEKRLTLPVWRYRDEFMKLLENQQVIVLFGETGSGKTTQIPQWCVEYCQSICDKCVACTQPRRLTTVKIAETVAKEMDVVLGYEVGYSIRFETVASSKTILKYLTEGMLFREFMNDPQLHVYGIVILDEVHERSIPTDLLLGLLKQLLLHRKDLKVVIMSATLDAGKFQKYFCNAPSITIQQRVHPVTIVYEKNSIKDCKQAVVDKVIKIHTSERTRGDIMAFLSGKEQIEDVCESIEKKLKMLGDNVGELMCIPLYSALPAEMQLEVFNPPPPDRANGAIGRKAIICTNIAETSLTVDGIVFVVDAGFSKQNIYNPKTQMGSLSEFAINQANAKQRAGRAGRTAPGKCFRLYTEKNFNENMHKNGIPEMLRSNLAGVALNLKKIGIKNINQFKFFDHPSPEHLKTAEELLKDIDALDGFGNLTELGSLMAEFPVDPQLSKIILTSINYHCSNEILKIVAMLSVENCFFMPKKKKDRPKAEQARQQFSHQSGDHMKLFNVYQAFEDNLKDSSWCKVNFLKYDMLITASKIRQQLQEILVRLKLLKDHKNLAKEKKMQNICKVILSGYFMQTAKWDAKSTRYLRTKDGLPVRIDRSSCLGEFRNCVVYDECLVSKDRYIKTVTEIKSEWLNEIAPNYQQKCFQN